MSYNNDPDPRTHGYGSDGAAYAWMARAPRSAMAHAVTSEDAMLSGNGMLRDAIDHQSRHVAAVRRERRRVDSLALVRRLVIALVCLCTVIAGALVAYVVFLYLGAPVTTVVRQVPARVVCEWVYVRRC